MRGIIYLFAVLAVLVTTSSAYVAYKGVPSQGYEVQSAGGVNQNGVPRRRSVGDEVYTGSLNRDPRKSGLEAVMLSIDTGAQPQPSRKSNSFDGVDKITSLLHLLTTSDKENNPIYRAKKEYGLKPQYVQLRASDEPSMKLEINSQNIMKALESILSSPLARRYADLAAKHAAAYYKAVVNDLKQRQ